MSSVNRAWETALVRAGKLLRVDLDSNAPERRPLGRYELGYALLGVTLTTQPFQTAKSPLTVPSCVARSGHVFKIPRQPELQPAPLDDGIECWLNMQSVVRTYPDSAHVDFLRPSPEGRM